VPEIRCNTRLHGVVNDNSKGILEVVCHNKHCKVNPNEVVTHRWDLEKVDKDNIIRPVLTFRSKRPEVKGIIR
jgi:hypothetical protein